MIALMTTDFIAEDGALAKTAEEVMATAATPQEGVAA